LHLHQSELRNSKDLVLPVGKTDALLLGKSVLRKIWAASLLILDAKKLSVIMGQDIPRRKKKKRTKAALRRICTSISPN
jgi:hypothetical protein